MSVKGLLAPVTAAAVVSGGISAVVQNTPTDEERGIYALEAFYDTADGSDWAPALTRLMRACAGCTVQLQRKAYKLRTPVDVCRVMDFRGAGGSADRVRSRFDTYGNTAFRVRHRWWCEAHGWPKGSTGQYTSFVDLGIHERSTPSPDNPRVAIKADVPLRLQNVWIRGFRHHVLASCNATNHARGVVCRFTPEKCKGVGGCNLVSIDQSHFSWSDHASILFDGPDSNAGNVFRTSIIYACRRAAQIKALTASTAEASRYARCGGIIDSSFLGNTYVANHLANHRLWDSQRRALTRVYHPDFIVDDPKGNQRSVFVGNYTEYSGLTSPLGKNSVQVGGMQASRGGLILRDRRIIGAGGLYLHQPVFVGKRVGLGMKDGLQMQFRFLFPGAEDGRDGVVGCWLDQRHIEGDRGRPADPRRHNRLICKYRHLNSRQLLNWYLAP